MAAQPEPVAVERARGQGADLDQLLALGQVELGDLAHPRTARDGAELAAPHPRDEVIAAPARLHDPDLPEFEPLGLPATGRRRARPIDIAGEVQAPLAVSARRCR